MPPSAKRSSIVSFWPGGEEDGWPACGWAKSERVKKSGHKKLTRQVFTAAPGSHIPAGKQFIAGGKTGMDLRLQSVANHLLRAGGVSPVARVVGCGLPVVLRDSGAGVRKGARSSISRLFATHRHDLRLKNPTWWSRCGGSGHVPDSGPERKNPRRIWLQRQSRRLPRAWDGVLAC